MVETYTAKVTVLPGRLVRRREILRKFRTAMKSGHADLPLHYGTVPAWLAQRMSLLGGAIVEAIVMEYGRSELLRRLGDPFWFQSLGCVLGMDWHSSCITTSVLNALKNPVNRRSEALGIYTGG